MKTLNEKLDQIARAEREREQEERGGGCLAGWAQLSPELEMEHCLGCWDALTNNN